MPLYEEIRNSAEGQALELTRTVAAAFRDLGWRTREGAAHQAGIADVAASRSWERPRRRETRVHLVARCQPGGRVVFAESTRATEDVIASYALDDATAPPPPAAPPARVHASAFRADDAFGEVLDDAFASIDGVLQDLREFDLDLVRDDLAAGAEAPEATAALARRREFVHAIVVTNAPLWLFGDRVAREPWLRLHRRRVIGADERWIDVVGADALPKYAAAAARYYAKRAQR